MDAAGNLYVNSFANDTVRKVDAATGLISTVWGVVGVAGTSGDNGPATGALLNQPAAVAVDSVGNLYINQYADGTVRKITATAAPQVFPGTVVGATSADQNVTLSNTGNQNLALINIAVDADFGRNAATTTCTSSTVVGPGGVCVLALNFAPTSAGTKTGNATVTDNTLNVGGSTQTVALSGSTSAVGSSGLVGLWTFDAGSGNTAADSSPSGNTGTLVNSPAWITGKIAGALQFNGRSNYVNVPDSSSLKSARVR